MIIPKGIPSPVEMEILAIMSDDVGRSIPETEAVYKKLKNEAMTLNRMGVVFKRLLRKRLVKSTKAILHNITVLQYEITPAGQKALVRGQEFYRDLAECSILRNKI